MIGGPLCQLFELRVSRPDVSAAQARVNLVQSKPRASESTMTELCDTAVLLAVQLSLAAVSAPWSALECARTPDSVQNTLIARWCRRQHGNKKIRSDLLNFSVTLGLVAQVMAKS